MQPSAIKNDVLAGKTVAGAMIFEFFSPGMSKILVNAGCKFMSGLRGSLTVEGIDDMTLKECPRFHDESLRDVLNLLKDYTDQFIVRIDHESLIALMHGLTHYKDLTPEFVAVV